MNDLTLKPGVVIHTNNMMQHYCFCTNSKGMYIESAHKRYCTECNGLIKTEGKMEPVIPVDATNPKDLLGVKKPRLSLVPPAGLVYAALAMANGADKYGPYNWREKKVQAMIYLEAAMRHILAYQDGEEFSADTSNPQVPHLGHALACLFILVDAKETGNLVDNRPKAGAMGALIERFTKK